MIDSVIVTDDGAVRIIRMNRPDKKNALTQPMYAEMTRALREIQTSEAVRCVMFAGSRPLPVLPTNRYSPGQPACLNVPKLDVVTLGCRKGEDS